MNEELKQAKVDLQKAIEKNMQVRKLLEVYDEMVEIPEELQENFDAEEDPYQNDKDLEAERLNNGRAEI